MGWPISQVSRDSSLLLRWATKPADSKPPGPAVFGLSSGHALPPELEGAGFQVTTHELDDLGFAETVRCANGLEGRSIFPGHFNDSTDISGMHR